MFLLYTYIKLTTNSILTIRSRNGGIDTVCQTTSCQNFIDVPISKHVTVEQENVFIVFNFVSLIKSFRRNVKKSCDFSDDKCYCSDC